jgi:two-component system, NarL family, sensor histidine kinase DesK
MLLIPKDRDLGWTPYAWLVYLAVFAVIPFVVGFPGRTQALSVAGAVAILPVYFWAYWQHGRRIIWVVAIFFLFGTFFGRMNPAASVFITYAACFLGQAGEPSVGFRYLGVLLAMVGLESWAFHFPPDYWGPALFFGVLLGSVTIHYAQRRRLTDRLLAAHEQSEQLAKIAERERIARDLHNLLGHTLSLIVLKSELASRLTETDPGRAAHEIRDVERISRDALAQVRAAVRGYRSAGFESELRQARETLEAAGVEVETALQPAPLSPTQESVFALALREAVTNVVRHAQATACRLTLRRDGPYCELEIADNGRGGTLNEGSGLSGMRERVEALGGILERDGSHGTLLRIRVPV